MPAKSFIYCMVNAAGEIKVGKSDNPEQRRRGLQGAHSSPLRIAWAHELPAQLVGKVERQLHAILGHVRLSGEWFAATPEAAREALTTAIADVRAAKTKRKQGPRSRNRAVIVGHIDEPVIPGVDIMPHYAGRKEMPLERRADSWRMYHLPDPPAGFDDWLVRWNGDRLEARAIKISLEGARCWLDIIEELEQGGGE